MTDPQHLAEMLSRLKNDGYAWVDGELDPAICGIAVPLRDQAGQVVAAISIIFSRLMQRISVDFPEPD